MPIELNPKDVAILRLLQQDAGLTSTAIAERLNLSQSPCWRRINHIEQQGIIIRRVALLDRDKLGMGVVAFATVNLINRGPESYQRFEQDVAEIAEVIECYTMAGAWDYMLKIVTRDMQHYESLLRERLLTMPLIRDLHSHIAVTEIKNTTELPLDTQL